MTDGTAPGSWCWRDYWTENFLIGRGYPAAWEEMPSEKYWPTIVWWDDD